MKKISLKTCLAAFLLLLTLSGDAQIITTYAGTGIAGYSGDGGPATAAQLYSPFGLAMDTAGNLFIAEQINHIIRKVAADGTISTYTGTGAAGYSGDGGPATNAKFSYPYAIALDHKGNLYFTDRDNNNIRKIDAAGIITTVPLIVRIICPPGAPLWIICSIPSGIAIDDSDIIYFTNFDLEVLKLKNDTAVLFAGNCLQSYRGDGGLATNAALNNPRGLACDHNGNLYIADNGNNVVRKVNRAGIISTYVGAGCPGSFHGDGGPATVAGMFGPFGVATDYAGNLFIEDFYNRRIRKVNSAGIITTVAGNGIAAYTGDGGPATAASFYDATGLAVDKYGFLYIADLWYSVIRKVTRANVRINDADIPQNDISLYPNPNKGVFYIKGQLTANAGEPLTLEVVNMSGQIVYKTILPARQNGIDAIIKLNENLSSGFYLLHISGTAADETIRFVVKK
jgi:trimeric autotransporter adhesin